MRDISNINNTNYLILLYVSFSRLRYTTASEVVMHMRSVWWFLYFSPSKAATPCLLRRSIVYASFSSRTPTDLFNTNLATCLCNKILFEPLTILIMIILKVQKLWGSRVEITTKDNWQGTIRYNLRYNYQNLVRSSCVKKQCSLRSLVFCLLPQP